MIDIPKGFTTLGAWFYQGSHLEYATSEEWIQSTVNGILRPGPDREAVKAFLSHVLSGPYSAADLKAIWEEFGADYNTSDHRGLLTELLKVLEQPYVKPKPPWR